MLRMMESQETIDWLVEEVVCHLELNRSNTLNPANASLASLPFSLHTLIIHSFIHSVTHSLHKRASGASRDLALEGGGNTAVKEADQVPAFLRDEVPSTSLGPVSAQAVPPPTTPECLFIFHPVQSFRVRLASPSPSGKLRGSITTSNTLRLLLRS